MDSLSFLHQWAEFNRLKWNCEAVVFSCQEPGSEAYCESVFFLNKQGRLYLPPLNPYHPTVFQATPTSKPYRVNKQWHVFADKLADEMLKVAGSANFILPPHIQDVRPFIWRNFKIDVKYTYYLKLPYSKEALTTAIRGKLKKAAAAGYRAECTTNLTDVHECLIGTENRKGFSHQLTIQDLELARSLFGDERFRSFVCYAKDGEPVSSSISILQGNGHAIGWLAGSKSEHLSYGVSQLLLSYELQDLHASGVQTFDLCGANIRSVSESKAAWQGELIPYYGIRVPSYKELFKSGRQWLQFNQNTVNG